MCILSETRKPQDQPFRDLVVFPLFFNSNLSPVIENKRNALILITDDGNGTAHRVGENLKIEEDTTVGVSEETTKPTSAEKSSNGLIYGIGGIILAGIDVLAGFLIKKKRG